MYTRAWSAHGLAIRAGRLGRTETKVELASIATQKQSASERPGGAVVHGAWSAAGRKDVHSVTWCHQVALRGSLGPQPVTFAPYASRVLYSYSYVGPICVCPSSCGNALTSLFHLHDGRGGVSFNLEAQGSIEVAAGPPPSFVPQKIGDSRMGVENFERLRHGHA